jgi:hypothetical protein
MNLKKHHEQSTGHGGVRNGAGRKRGVRNKKTKELLEAVAASGIIPLDYMLAVMRDETAPDERRDAMAIAAAPYCHPRLSAIEHGGKGAGPIQGEIRIVLVDPKARKT